MKEIPLTQGKVAMVDDEDFDYLNQFKWCAHKDRNTFYASRNTSATLGKRKYQPMHRVIIIPEELQVDHLDGNGLNNQKLNMRITTARGNGQNLHIKKTSKYPGVRIDKLGKKWQAEIKIVGKKRHLGTYADEFTAFKTYVVATVVLAGE